VNGLLDRKAFVRTLGAAGLGLGMTAAGGPRPAQAQESSRAAGPGWDRGAGMLDEHWKLLAAFYKDFTASLADELRGTNADEVDAAIRKAMMAMIDAHKDDGFLTYGQAEALKVVIATTDVPLGPGPIGMALFGFHGGMAAGHFGMGHGMPMGGMQPCEGGMERGGPQPAHGGMEQEGMMPGHEGMPSGGMQPGVGGMEMAGMQPGQESSQPSRKHDRKTRRDGDR
jgi:hypothetical protein